MMLIGPESKNSHVEMGIEIIGNVDTRATLALFQPSLCLAIITRAHWKPRNDTSEPKDMSQVKVL